MIDPGPEIVLVRFDLFSRLLIEQGTVASPPLALGLELLTEHYAPVALITSVPCFITAIWVRRYISGTAGDSAGAASVALSTRHTSVTM